MSNKLHRIAERVADDQTGADFYIAGLVTSEMREKMSIAEGAQPFDKGTSSAVFENEQGRIVSFFPQSSIYEVANKLKGKNLSTLPEIYEVEIFVDENMENETLYAIEMEKLQPLDDAEEDHLLDILDGSLHLDDIVPKKVEELSQSDLGRASLDLISRLKQEGIIHTDLHIQNIAWTPDGKLKAIDFGGVLPDDMEGLMMSSFPKFSSPSF